MRCTDFLDNYSDYRDGRITDPLAIRRLTEHLANCPCCSRYDACLRRGVMALRSSPDLEPSSGFLANLKARLHGIDEGAIPAIRGAAGITMALILIAAISLVVYEGGGRETGEGQLSITQAASPAMPLVVANPGPPFITFTEIAVPAFEAIPVHTQLPEIPLGVWANLPR